MYPEAEKTAALPQRLAKVKARTHDATFLATVCTTVAEVGSSSLLQPLRATLHRVTPPKTLVARNIARKVASCVWAFR